LLRTFDLEKKPDELVAYTLVSLAALGLLKASKVV